MLEALCGRKHLAITYAEALREGYLWHEFGDLHPDPALVEHTSRPGIEYSIPGLLVVTLRMRYESCCFSQARDVATSLVICAISAAMPSNFCSPRSRCRKSSRSVSP